MQVAGAAVIGRDRVAARGRAVSPVFRHCSGSPKIYVRTWNPTPSISRRRCANATVFPTSSQPQCYRTATDAHLNLLLSIKGLGP
jgi:hypothetical protein